MRPQNSLLPSSAHLLVFDGLEESGGWQQWEPLMADLAVECKRRSRLRLLLTMRPETACRLHVPGEFAVQYVHEDADIALPELFRRYCKQYKVNAHEVPWLDWAVRTPLEIRLIAEEFRERTLTHNDGLRANVIGLFQRKLIRMEDEARTTAGAKAWSMRLSLLRAVLSAIVALMHDLKQPMVEDRAIIQLVKEEDDEFTAERIRIALQQLVSHGLVDERQPSSRELVATWPVYGGTELPRAISLTSSWHRVPSPVVCCLYYVVDRSRATQRALWHDQKRLSCLLRFSLKKGTS
jgi:hypothetical protein